MPKEDSVRVHSTALSHNQQGQKNSKPAAKHKKSYIEIEKGLLTCVGEVGPNDDVAVTKPFCDAIWIVGWVDADCLAPIGQSTDHISKQLNQVWAQASSTLKGMEKVGEAADAKFKLVRTSGYVSGKTRVGADKASAVLGVGTGKSKTPDRFRLKLHFNPHRLGPEGHTEIEAALATVLGSNFCFERWLAEAKLTKLDAAVDIINLDVCDAILRSNLGNKWSGWFGQPGRVETWSQLAQRNKRGKEPPIIKLYDKRRERLNKSKDPAWGLVPYARLERRVQQNKTPFVGLGKLKNPFAEISVGHAGFVAGKEGKEFLLYHAATRWMGLEQASKLLSDDIRIRWRSAIYHGDAPFWRPQLIWPGWKNSLQEDGLWDWVVRAAKVASKT